MGTVALRDPDGIWTKSNKSVQFYKVGTDSGSYEPVDSGFFVCLRIKVTSSMEKLTSLSVAFNFVMGVDWEGYHSTGKYLNLSAYLHDKDRFAPSVSSVTTNAIGSSVLSNVYVKPASSGQGTRATFRFENIDVTDKPYLYLWVLSNNVPVSDPEDSCHLQIKATIYADESITGEFERISPELSWNVNTVTTDDEIMLTVKNCPAETTVQVKYGSTVLASSVWGEDKASVEVTYGANSLKRFFATAGVTTLQRITITATVDGYPTVTASFTLTAGSNMQPTIGTPTVTIVQPERIQQTFPNTWIANISRAKIEVTASTGSNAGIRTVVANYGSESVTMTLNNTTGKYEATTSKPVTGDCVFTVIVTDERGMTNRSTYSLTGVAAYTKPAIIINDYYTYRCNASGTAQDGGPYVRVLASVNYDTGISGNTLEFFRFYVSEDGSSTTYTLQNNTQSEPVQLLSPRPDNTITIVVETQDKISDVITSKIILGGAHRDILVKRRDGKTTIGVGGAPNTLYGHRFGRVDGIDIANGGGYYVRGIDTINFIGARGTLNNSEWGKDFLAYNMDDAKAPVNETTEFQILPSAISQWSNLPQNIVDQDRYFCGLRFVISGSSSVAVVVIEYEPVLGRIWINRKHVSFSEWSGWKGHTPDIT